MSADAGAFPRAVSSAWLLGSSAPDLCIPVVGFSPVADFPRSADLTVHRDDVGERRAARELWRWSPRSGGHAGSALHVWHLRAVRALPAHGLRRDP